MNEQTPMYGSPDGQHPHVPGHDPQGSGLPRQREAGQAEPARPADDTSSGPVDDDAPLGGDENTEDQLTADTAVERDALKSLDPDDTPA
ncbi:hypothetical protein [Microbacterium commune]|uniref:hypothetical protein n=1 Tax=Microbacterium commune TaxID=2762219 RepID=UPI001CD878F8|nr:hypothetical protein [Microbacterium commune]